MTHYFTKYQLPGMTPRQANIAWFRQTKFGLFLHYGLYSMCGEKFCEPEEKLTEWSQFFHKIPVSEYAELEKKFNPKQFSANEIVKFAKNNGFDYINLTTRHHDSFCLWDTAYTDFNSMKAPCKRDLVKELYEECVSQDIPLFLYYSHGRDWKHPHAPNLGQGWDHTVRPHYDFEESSYAKEDHDLNIYLDFMKKQIAELIEKFPEAAGIWLDGISVPQSGDYTKFKVNELYSMIREKSPHFLISYKQGLLGTEDFFAPEHEVPKSQSGGMEHQKNRIGKIAEYQDKIIEVCTTMIKDPCSWGYKKGAQHLSAQEVLQKMKSAQENGYKLLLNLGLKPDGAIEECDKNAITLASKMFFE